MDNKTRDSLLSIVKKNYDAIAEDFNETRKKEIWPRLKTYADMVNSGDSVLDAGCGNGRLLKAFRLKTIRYVGLDSNRKFIDFANASWVIPNGKFVFGDILELDKNKEIEEKFDFVFCIAVIHNIPSEELRRQALAQLSAKLNENGRMVITAWNLWNRWRYFKNILKYGLLKLVGLNAMDYGDILFQWGSKKSMRYYHAFTSHELISLVESSGLVVEDFLKDGFNYYLVARK